MNSDVIKSWLKRKKTLGCVQYVSLGLFALFAGIFLLFLTFWLAYGVMWFGKFGISAAAELALNRKVNLHLSHPILLICSGIFIVLLFIQHLRTNPSYWGEYPRRDYQSAPGFAMQARLFGAFGMMLAYPGASANMVADLLLVGPRLVTGAPRLIAKGMHFRKLDEDGCARLLAFLLSRIHATPYEELKCAGWEDWFDQLRLIDGVEFLQKGLLLSNELRNEIAGSS